LRRYRLRLSDNGDSTIINPTRLDHVASSQLCGQCHGVYIERDEFAMKYATHGGLYRPGDDLFRTRYYIQHPETDPTAARQKDLARNPEFFRERWWDDGTILAGGREFTAMSASACYQRGELSCLTCHTMHRGEPADQLRPELQRNASCTSCHPQAKYTSDVTRHTFHRADSVGSQCLNCHMPHTSYALFGALRSHQILVPRVASSVRHGVPNACNLCHLDRTLEWTQQQLFAWYGTQPMALNEEQRQVSAALLWLLKGDAAQRVIAVWHFGWDAAHQASGADWLAPFVAQLLADPYGVVRYVAFDALRKLPAMAALNYDFLGTKDEWEATRDQAVERWRSSRNVVGRGPQTLIDPAIGMDAKRVRELLEQRNNRPVSIKE
jgi:hypothetical protein